METEETESPKQVKLTSESDEIKPDMPNLGRHGDVVTKGHQSNYPILDFIEDDRCHLTFLFEASALRALNQEHAIGVR